MGAEHLDQTFATEDDSLCGGWLLVASWWFPTPCCDVVSLGEVPPKVSTSSRWKRGLHINGRRYRAKLQREGFQNWNLKFVRARASIGQLNTRRIGQRTFGERSKNANGCIGLKILEGSNLKTNDFRFQMILPCFLSFHISSVTVIIDDVRGVRLGV